MTTTLSVFLNPTAGRGKAGKRRPRIVELLERHGISVSLHTSRDVGHLEEQVFDAVSEGEHRIIVAGGDGSIHEAVNGIMRAEGSAQLGVIPTGTGNDFAKACSIPLDWEHATRLLAERSTTDAVFRRIDIGRMNDRYFANGAGVGFDAKVTRVARSYGWPIGDFVYLFAIFRCMADGIATPEMTIVSDGLEWRGPVTLVSISNGPWIGGMFHIAPMASNDDARLELLRADPVSRLRITSLLPKLVRGKHMNEPEIRHASVQQVVIEAASRMESHLDGEVQPLADRFEIEILPGALELI